jgi:hypothetical protein
MADNNFKSGEELNFNIYGVRIKGKFMSMKDDNVILVSVISDTSGVLVKGEITKLNKRFLLTETLNKII